MGIEALINRGMVEINGPAQTAHQRTLIVLGTARSGTSLAAGVLHHLGLFMGEMASAPVYEDTRLAEATESAWLAPTTEIQGSSHHLKCTQAIIDEYNSAHHVWGWKRPSSLHYLDKLHGEIRNPVYIVMFKDVLAIANRNLISMGSNLLPAVRQALAEYGLLVDFLSRENPPALLVSYDKAMANKADFVKSLAGLTGLDHSEEQRTAAQSFIDPSSATYLRATRAHRFIGSLDLVETRRVAGWASRVGSQVSVRIGIFVNDQYVASSTANLFRPDLKKVGVSATGRIAFDVAISPPLNPGDVVRVRPVDDVVDLNNSPRVA